MAKKIKSEKPKLLITGGFGFIAGHVIQEAYAQGYQVYALARRQSFNLADHKHLIDCGVELYLGDIRDKTFVARAISLVDGVINLAGILGTQETVNDPYPSIESNILGAVNVFEGCRQFKKPCVQIAVGNHWMANSYAITKTTAERFAEMYAREHGVAVNVVRGLNAFGERQKAEPVKKIIPQFVTKAIKGENLTVYGDGEQLMDMVYVKDLAKVLLDVLKKTSDPTHPFHQGGAVYDGGTGIGLKVKDIAQKCIDFSNSSSTIDYVPMRPGESDKAVVVAERPYSIEYTPFDTALRETIHWYQDKMLLPE